MKANTAATVTAIVSMIATLLAMTINVPVAPDEQSAMVTGAVAVLAVGARVWLALSGFLPARGRD